MKCGGCGTEIDGPGSAMMEHYRACPQFAPDRVEVRRLQRKLARARQQRDKLRRDMAAIVKHNHDLVHPAITFWHGKYMQVKYPTPPPPPPANEEQKR